MLICDIEKNVKKRIRISIEEHRGHKYCPLSNTAKEGMTADSFLPS